MSKKERNSAARRKRAADPNQPQKSGAAAPTMVSTDPKKKMKNENMHSNWRNEELFLYEVKDKKGKGSGKKDACYHKVKSRYSVWPSAYASGALVKCRKKGAANWGNSSKKESYDPTASFQQFQEKCWKGYEKKGMKTMFGKRYPNCVKKTKSEEVEVDSSSVQLEAKVDKVIYSDKPESGKKLAQGQRSPNAVGRTTLRNMRKFDSATGHGDSMQRTMETSIRRSEHRRKRGVKTKGMKEAYSANPAQQAAIAIAKKKKQESDMVAKKMKKEDWRSELNYVEEAKKKMVKVKLGDPSKIKVKVTDIGAGGKEYVRKDEMKEEFVAEAESAPNNEQQSRKKNKPKLTPIKKILDKVKYDIADKAAKHKMKQDNPDPESFTEGKSPAWQRKAGKNPSGGLNAKGVASYRAANPGSKLKTAVTTKPSKLKKGSKAANRRKSFCARMKGMKKRLTSAKTARDPDSRINKSLRKWNC